MVKETGLCSDMRSALASASRRYAAPEHNKPSNDFAFLQISEALVNAIRSRHSRLDDSAVLTWIKRLLDHDRHIGPAALPD